MRAEIYPEGGIYAFHASVCVGPVAGMWKLVSELFEGQRRTCQPPLCESRPRRLRVAYPIPDPGAYARPPTFHCGRHLVTPHSPDLFSVIYYPVLAISHVFQEHGCVC